MILITFLAVFNSSLSVFNYSKKYYKTALINAFAAGMNFDYLISTLL